MSRNGTADAKTDKTTRLTTADMLREELRHVRGIPAAATADEISCKLREPLSALCFSGGGIRSAAFNLGVARALAKSRLLGKFDYLSTVSGGGYIGAWLQVLIREQRHDEPHANHSRRIALAEAKLEQHETGALDRLRDHTNFLTPHAGFASPDTWAGVALYLRNLVLNWLVLLPVLFLVVLAPLFHRTAIWQAGFSDGWTLMVLGVSWLGLCFAVWRTCRALPSHLDEASDDWRKPPHAQPQGWGSIMTRPIPWIVGAALAWAVTAPVALQHLSVNDPRVLGVTLLAWVPTWVPGCGPSDYALSGCSPPAWAILPGLHLAAMLAGYGVAWLWPKQRFAPWPTD